MDLKRFEQLRADRFIAAAPAEPRDSSRLMLLERATGGIAHLVFRDIERVFRPGDLLVLNDSKVFPARITGRKPTGGRIGLLLMSEREPGLWEAIGSGSRLNAAIQFEDGVTALAVENCGGGKWLFRFSTRDVLGYALKHGNMPLPPYIEKLRRRLNESVSAPQDRQRYQTVYARTTGSIAAPTAGFHFTAELLERVKARGVVVAYVTLHVGWGTFKPLRDSSVEQHVMLPEYAVMPEATARLINETVARGGRVFSAGTTSTRTIESFSSDTGIVSPGAKWADLYIYPPYRFKTVSALITNFHVPDSTPICLTAAFAGEDFLYRAYEQAVARQYRFYSYGDAMLII
ncbi:MAG: tRNA preQ1(34) S-adenosylmethionine ribosyltransferase-isomerase QueA [Elusimicrobiaceae bacterium]|nr:tRNA preQ1(34) S-adenosylmethionine ribosyltransferase-isomerase QueA [Elusimicrobiaceae bacterium]